MRQLLPACFVLALLPMLACDDPVKEEKPSAPPVVKAEAAPTHHDLTPTEMSSSLNGERWTLEPSKTFRLEGDLRPFWIVTGLIKNSSGGDIKSVRVRVIAYDKSEAKETILDTAEFDVQDIPAFEAKAFRRDVQLMISQGKFRWNYEFLSATVKASD